MSNYYLEEKDVDWTIGWFVTYAPHGHLELWFDRMPKGSNSFERLPALEAIARKWTTVDAMIFFVNRESYRKYLEGKHIVQLDNNEMLSALKKAGLPTTKEF